MAPFFAFMIAQLLQLGMAGLAGKHIIPLDGLTFPQVVTGYIGTGRRSWRSPHSPHGVVEGNLGRIIGVDAVFVVVAITYPETGVVFEACGSQLGFGDNFQRRGREAEINLAIDMEGEIGNGRHAFNQCAVYPFGMAGITECVLVVCTGGNSLVVTGIAGDGSGLSCYTVAGGTRSSSSQFAGGAFKDVVVVEANLVGSMGAGSR